MEIWISWIYRFLSYHKKLLATVPMADTFNHRRYSLTIVFFPETLFYLVFLILNTCHGGRLLLLYLISVVFFLWSPSSVDWTCFQIVRETKQHLNWTLLVLFRNVETLTYIFALVSSSSLGPVESANRLFFFHLFLVVLLIHTISVSIPLSSYHTLFTLCFFHPTILKSFHWLLTVSLAFITLFYIFVFFKCILPPS